jgi:polar amino acid transport system permease protein
MSADADRPAARRRASPRLRARRFRMAQYAILAIVLALAAEFAKWREIGRTFFEPRLIEFTILHGLANALLNTALYTAGAFVLGLVLGLVLALMRLSPVAPYRWLATVYIEFFRGLPSLVVFIAFSLLPLAFSGLTIPWSPYGTVWVALGVVGSAYMAETMRAGIQAVPKGQVEAARSLGMSTAQAMRKIVLMQALRLMVPPLTNELIMLIKDSSLVFVVGLSAGQFDLTEFGRSTANTNVNITPLVVAGLGYLLITLPLSMLVRRMEVSRVTGA